MMGEIVGTLDQERRTVCVVANSPNLLDEELGEKIDSCDVVIRMNVFKIQGYEKHVGLKTNIAAFTFRPTRIKFMFKETEVLKINDVQFWSTQPFDPKLDSNGLDRAASCAKLIGTRDIKNPGKKIWTHLIDNVCPNYWRKNPSSGITVIEMAMEEFSEFEIFYCGFDKTVDKAHYCSDHVDYSTLKNPAGHNWVGEYEYIQKLVKSGKIRHIRDKK